MNHENRHKEKKNMNGDGVATATTTNERRTTREELQKATNKIGAIAGAWHHWLSQTAKCYIYSQRKQNEIPATSCASKSVVVVPGNAASED